jgi:hypothetical protein
MSVWSDTKRLPMVNDKTRKKSEIIVFLVQVKKAQRGNKSIAALILNLGTR